MKTALLGVLLASLLGVVSAPRLATHFPDLFESIGRDARAGTAVRLDTTGLVDAAQLIVEAEVESATAFEASDGIVDTEYHLQVMRTFLGEDLTARSIRLPGGVLEDGRGLILPGLPHPAVGERVILFLTGQGPSLRRMPVGLGQGRWRVVPGSNGELAVLTEMAGVTLLDDQGNEGHLPPSNWVRSYAQGVAEIQAAVNARLARGEESSQ